MESKSYLRICILKSIARRPSSGYDLMKQLQALTGKKPSAGSIYPILEELRSGNLVRSTATHRKTVYQITPSGKKQLKSMLALRGELLDTMLHQVKMLDLMTEMNIAPFVAQMFARLKKGESAFGELEPVLERNRDSLVALMRAGKLKSKHAKVRDIIMRSTKELEAL